MFDNPEKLSDIKEYFLESKYTPRKVYLKPHLEELGDLRTLTLGASTGAVIESGVTWWTPP